jgi:hypothetical protein
MTLGEGCGKREKSCETVLTNLGGMLFFIGLKNAFLLDRGAYRSLTTDTMCQNLFETIRIRAGWIE